MDSSSSLDYLQTNTRCQVAPQMDTHLKPLISAARTDSFLWGIHDKLNIIKFPVTKTTRRPCGGVHYQDCVYSAILTCVLNRVPAIVCLKIPACRCVCVVTSHWQCLLGNRQPEREQESTSRISKASGWSWLWWKTAREEKNERTTATILETSSPTATL